MCVCVYRVNETGSLMLVSSEERDGAALCVCVCLHEAVSVPRKDGF